MGNKEIDEIRGLKWQLSRQMHFNRGEGINPVGGGDEFLFFISLYLLFLISCIPLWRVL